ncbi:MAG: hypothetical protein HKN87_02330 [Saprospiraceae bacterium]|nr:hypothetical protein [Saprospiraceae bacterium]
MNKKIIWFLGFVILFLINLAVEFFLLPLWDLDNTSRNDIYFKIWWLAVAGWFFFGFILLTRRNHIVK